MPVAGSGEGVGNRLFCQAKTGDGQTTRLREGGRRRLSYVYCQEYMSRVILHIAIQGRPGALVTLPVDGMHGVHAS